MDHPEIPWLFETSCFVMWRDFTHLDLQYLPAKNGARASVLFFLNEI